MPRAARRRFTSPLVEHPGDYSVRVQPEIAGEFPAGWFREEEKKVNVKRAVIAVFPARSLSLAGLEQS